MARAAIASGGAFEVERAGWLLGSGGVWPVAALFGALSAAAASLGAWAAAWLAGGERPWFVLDWIAEHALWGTLIGVVLTLVLRLGARFDPELSDLGRRRAAAARLSTVCVGLGLFCLTAVLAGNRGAAWQRVTIELVGAAAGLGLAWVLLGRRLAGSARFAVLPVLDPLRVAVLLAVVTLPLAAGVRRAPLDAQGPAVRTERALSQLRASLPAALAVALLDRVQTLTDQRAGLFGVLPGLLERYIGEGA